MDTPIDTSPLRGPDDGCWFFIGGARAGGETWAAVIGIRDRRIVGLNYCGRNCVVIEAYEPNPTGAARAVIELDGQRIPLRFELGGLADHNAELFHATLASSNELKGLAHRMAGWDTTCLQDDRATDLDGAWHCIGATSQMTVRIVDGRITEIHWDGFPGRITRSPQANNAMGVAVDFVELGKKYTVSLALGSGANEREAVFLGRHVAGQTLGIVRVKRLDAVGQN